MKQKKVHLKNSKYQGHVPGIWNLKKIQMLFDIFTVLKKKLIDTKNMCWSVTTNCFHMF